MRLFISDNCWDVIIDLPKHVQGKIKDFQKKFKENPFSHNINLEKIKNFKDSSMRTARVSDEYRAVIGVLPGDEYCLLHIDHHDEAMDWAKNKKFVWNDYVGSFQIVPVIETVQESASEYEVKEKNKTSLPFENFKEEELLMIGVPEELLSLVKGIVDMNDLDSKHNLLPEDVFERLFYLIDEDMTLHEIIEEIEAGKGNEREGANNRMRFVEITDDKDLEAMIDESPEKWQIFLHPSQRLLVEGNYKGAVKVSGGGGTGKTVAALHRLKRLSENGETAGVLYTSYTKALISNIENRIKSLGINPKSVVLDNIDMVAYNLADDYDLLKGKEINLNYDDTKKIWRKLAEENLSEFSADFLASEYADIISYNNIKTEEQYKKVSRIGRGKPISPKQRKEIWKLIESFRNLRDSQGIVERIDLFNIVSDYLNENNIRPYKHVIADEIQDFSNPELRFLRSLVAEGENDLFLVGDPYQRIYNTKGINFSAAGINIKGKRSKRLKINYRTTEEIKRTATALVNGYDYDDFDGENESLKGYLSLMHGEKPIYKIFPSRDEEIEFIINKIKEFHNAGINYREMTIGCQYKDSLKRFQTALHNSGIPYKNLSGKGDNDGVVLSTLHKLKGLEFKIVFIADVDSESFDYVPWNIDKTDKKAMKMYEQSKRSLLYVAITRAMQRVIITGVGKKPEALISI